MRPSSASGSACASVFAFAAAPLGAHFSQLQQLLLTVHAMFALAMTMTLMPQILFLITQDVLA